MTYESDIVLGEKYRDTQTGIQGVATAIYFFQHACERATLERVKMTEHGAGEILENTFDAPRLEHIESGTRAQSSRPGGPSRASEGARPGPA